MSIDTEVQQAIAYIQECRQTHVDWADWQESNPNWQDYVEPTSPGLPDHHREWVDKYDHVLKILYSMQLCEHGMKADPGGWLFCCDYEPW